MPVGRAGFRPPTQGAPLKKYLIAAAATLLAASAFAQTEPFGSFKRPFTADSPWNIRPIGPVFGAFVIPTESSGNYGAVAGGTFSTTAFLAKPEDPPMIVALVKVKNGDTDPDARESPTSVTIPRWPATAAPATGSDGHAEIFDPVTGRIHSFWQLRLVNGKWTAAMHAWSAVNGRGWGDPSHLKQGARAAGVSTIGGLIRAHEINDGQSSYQHALAMALSLKSLAANPAYVYPATSADFDAYKDNKGEIPEGALMMLPQDFVLNNANPTLQKVVNTLKTYGARVVDRNTLTPFSIYVENGGAWPLYSGSNLTPVYQSMEQIRLALRQVISASSYVDGNGNPTTANVPGNFNILSMRGPWKIEKPAGGTLGRFNTFTQSVEFPSNPAQVEQSNGNGTGIAGGESTSANAVGVSWGRPVAGATYAVTAIGSGGASVRVVLWKGGAVASDSGYLSNGQTAQVTWPSSGGWTTIYTRSAPNQAGSIRATMIKQ